MQSVKAVLAATVLAVVAIAGCSGGGSDGGISVKGTAPTFTFTAPGGADNFTWDLGDHLTKAYTKSVTHTYDFANGNLNVVLTMTKDGKKTEHRKALALGNGQNTNAGFVLEGSSNWTVLGESVTLSAHRSTDPDGDALRYAWSCQRVSDAVRQTVHTHPGFGGVPFATPPAGAVLSINAQGPLPGADRAVSGDLCEGLGQSGKASRDTTITGAFTKSGIYDIYLLASDPVHPTTSGKYRVVVTPAGERPKDRQTVEFSGAYLVGAGGALQGIACDSLSQCDTTLDRTSHSLTTSLAAQVVSAELVYDDITNAMTITCTFTRGINAVGSVAGPQNVTFAPADFPAGTYAIVCQPEVVVPTSPAGLGYTLKVFLDLDLDPFKVY